MRIATWNINGVKARIEALTAWLKEASPDVVCLQEIKSVDEGFPREPISALGYNIETHGQKGFNGVAILSKRPMEDVRRGLPGDEPDAQSRFIEALVPGENGMVRVCSAYMPNGNPIGTEKFALKIDWHARLEGWAARKLELEEPLVIAGDYNIIPEPIDTKYPENWSGDALYQPESREAFRRLCALGLTDAIRAVDDRPGVFTFWDYQAGAFQKNNGIRIDHLLLSPEASDLLIQVGIDKHVRAWEKPSDHVPVWVELAA
ncbi:Exodeoxyribonuclease III [Faunimonas pinastri]|uniref:Exodeoxyribonuclease III n=1 Tax=Faunimonas pinastri TaxID=1855383 RepID=A0A1H9CTG7_9HYPH|nr:exodeoxyribonuclease III [Faunimonas pinastri]SEQ04449.1 Exodeoxyribonuclease III [Faunimonas pinastri]